jgi:hypothetical protein
VKELCVKNVKRSVLMSEIKELEKEIKENLFQLNKDELKIIIRHIQSMINKQYMGEEIHNEKE